MAKARRKAGRPVNADPAATRAGILDVARELMSVSGASGMTLRDVAARAGVSLATITHHFPNKEALVDACLESVGAGMAALRDRFMPLAMASPNAEDLLSHLAREAFRFVREHQVDARLATRTVVDTGRSHDRMRQQFLEPYLENGSALLAAASGAPLLHCRMMLLTLNYLAIRYGLVHDEELVMVTGAPDLPTAVRRVEEHLVTVMRALLHHAPPPDGP